MVEIGWQQGGAVRDFFQSAGLQDIRCVADLEGRDRVVMGIQPR
jgi:release factor glutamine methyltransferase